MKILILLFVFSFPIKKIGKCDMSQHEIRVQQIINYIDTSETLKTRFFEHERIRKFKKYSKYFYYYDSSIKMTSVEKRRCDSATYNKGINPLSDIPIYIRQAILKVPKKSIGVFCRVVQVDSNCFACDYYWIAKAELTRKTSPILRSGFSVFFHFTENSIEKISVRTAIY